MSIVGSVMEESPPQPPQSQESSPPPQIANNNDNEKNTTTTNKDDDKRTRLASLASRLASRSVLKETDQLTTDDIRFLSSEMTAVLTSPPAPFLELEPPLVVCGDIHGQYDDLLRIMRRFGWPPKTRYLFLGDYVDRGTHSIETICTIFAMHAVFPNQFFVLKGNHETKDVNRLYGFLEECERRFPKENLCDSVNDVFQWLPVAALVGKRIFCAHGGISRDITTWDDVRKVEFPTDCPDTGVVADVLWSDPSETATGFVMSGRGQGHLFGPDALEQFCQRMEIDLVVRAHQVHPAGYRVFADERLITVFSAPNYGGFHNDAACLIIDEDMGCHIEILTPRCKKHKNGDGTVSPSEGTSSTINS